MELLKYQRKTKRLNDDIQNNGWWSTEMERNDYEKIVNDVETLKKRVFGGSSGLEYNLQLLRNRTRIVQQIMLRYRNTLSEAEKRLQDLFERLQKDNCQSNPCLNGGTCINLYQGFMCKCPSQFEVRSVFFATLFYLSNLNM